MEIGNSEKSYVKQCGGNGGKVRGKKYSCTGKSLRARNKGVSMGTVNREPCHVVMSLGTDTNLSTQTSGAG